MSDTEEFPLLPFDEEDAQLADDGFTALSAAKARIVQLESERRRIAAAWRKQKEWMRAEPFSREPRACAELDALLEKREAMVTGDSRQYYRIDRQESLNVWRASVVEVCADSETDALRQWCRIHGFDPEISDPNLRAVKL